MTTVGNLIKKNKLMVIVALIYLALLAVSPDKATSSFNNSIYYLKEMLQVLPIIFLLTVVIEAWIPKELIIRHFGEKSGWMGNLLSLLLGSLSAGPIYAAFPISKALLGKGASISNVVIILSAWAVIKFPMLANEAKFLGVEFMAARWVLTVLAILLMAWLVGKFVKKSDLPAPEKTDSLVVIRQDYCIGCGICAKMMPMVYEMQENKAVVRADAPTLMPPEKIRQTVQKCPTKAITYTGKEK
ncbi:MAG: permease [Eubacteriales bacterium]|nr:permease [Eubacteriales bacterium]